jgi:hypothetical protein
MVALMDLDFADDLSLLSYEIVQAQELLLSVEKDCNKKTKSLLLNIESPTPLHTADVLEWVENLI